MSVLFPQGSWDTGVLASRLFILIMMFTVETLQDVEENQDALVHDRKGSWVQHSPSWGV